LMRRRGLGLLVGLLIVGLLPSTAAATTPLGVGEARHYLLKFEHEWMADHPEEVDVTVSACFRLGRLKVSCAETVYYDTTKLGEFTCRNRVTIYVRSNHYRLKIHPGACH
jgi:hypothetical protein